MILESDQEGSFSKQENIHFVEDLFLEDVTDIRTEDTQVDIVFISRDIFGQGVRIMQ